VATPAAPPTPAATVILFRTTPELQVFLLRRHRKSSFMSDAFVFPGGKVDPADGNAETAALRELYEEAGVLLVREATTPEQREIWRRRLLGDELTFPKLLAAESLTPATERLHWWARWITPSVEPKRFDAEFFLAELPPDQTPSFDQKETVEELWISPAEALLRQTRGEIRLPPPQMRTLAELQAAGDRLAGLIALSAERRAHAAPVCPRFAMFGDTFAVLLPWDPAYADAPGEGWPLPASHPLAGGVSRFVRDGMTWRMATG
jgi:8-oxo-dGTP pyrophosphatase MutT (NUDIX family)